jgi:hypothetical protein
MLSVPGPGERNAQYSKREGRRKWFLEKNERPKSPQQHLEKRLK